MNSKDIVDLCKVNFCISSYNTGSYCVQITGGANIYIYNCASVYWSICVLYVFACVISNQSTSKNHVIPVKPSVNFLPWSIQQGAAGITVTRLKKFRSTHSAKAKKQQKECRWVEALGKIWIRGISNIGSLHKKWVVRKPLPTIIIYHKCLNIEVHIYCPK